jgi:NDP-sugar pyrophosphorylase family protein
MKALLICPSHRPAVPHLSADGPLATVPIYGDCLVGHWVEHLAARGARHIQVVAVGDTDPVKAAVGDGARWGVRVSVAASNSEPTRDEALARFRPAGEAGWLPAPLDAVPMSHLPGCPGTPLFESYASWFAALMAWMPRALTPTRVRMAEIQPGVWIGSRARVSPKARLVAPCWVGDQASVETGAVVGPGAIVEDRAIVSARAVVSRSWVGPDTFVGPMTAVANSLALGATLINWHSDSSLRVPDPFLLSSLTGAKPAGAPERAARAPSTAARTAAQASLMTGLRAGVGHPPEVKVPG